MLSIFKTSSDASNSDASNSSNSGSELIKGMGLMSAIAIVVGSMIGSGIFIAPSLMATYVKSPGIILSLWVFGGIFTLLGSLSYGELATMYPKAGGQYVYLREAYSPLVAFLFGWTLLGVIQTGFIAAVSVAFAKYLGIFFPALSENNLLIAFNIPLTNNVFAINWAQIIGIISILFLTYVNTLGVKTGAGVQNVSTILKVLAIIILALLAIFSGKGDISNLSPLLLPTDINAGTTNTIFSGAMIALLAVALSKALFAYDAWNTVTFTAEEIKSPEKNLPRALVWGTILVLVVNTLITFAYFYLMPIETAANVADNRIGAEVAKIVFGPIGVYFISIAILISTFGCNNGLILGGARVFYAMAKDKVFFKSFGNVDKKHRTPTVALYWQAFWASILTLTGSYSDLLTYTTFASVLFNTMTVIAVLVLRKKSPELNRPYRTWGYPLVPLGYIVIASAFMLFILQGDFINSIKGLGLIAIGVPVYFFFKLRASRTQ